VSSNFISFRKTNHYKKVFFCLGLFLILLTQLLSQKSGYYFTCNYPIIFVCFQVSWIRRRDYHLLTVGLNTYSSDERFTVEHVRHLQTWALKIKFVSHLDEGMYECQVSTHPTTSIFIRLNIVGESPPFTQRPRLGLVK